MTTINTKILDANSNEMVDAEILNDITDKSLSQWNDLWIPFFRELNETQEKDLGFTRFDWNGFINNIQSEENSRKYALVRNGRTEGMMILSLNKQPEKENKYPSKDLVYVDYLGVAPWNQNFPGYDRKFKGVGGALIGCAIDLSVAEGFNGRLGLHTLENTDEFFKLMKMQDFGLDANGLKYFELQQVEF